MAIDPKVREKRIAKDRLNDPKSPSDSGRSIKYDEEFRNFWNAFVFVHRKALDLKALDYFSGGRDTIVTRVVLGKKAKHPLALDRPLIVADMSFGALSETTKLALAKGATKAGIAHSTGEGGTLPGERDFASRLIIQYSTGRFGWPERERDKYKTEEEYEAACREYVKSCVAICFKFGQGAKPGQGGLLRADKVTKRIAEIRKIEAHKNCHSPASHYDIKTLDDLKKKIEWLRKISDGKPIIVKFGAGHIENDIRLAVEAGADIIEIDGAEGGTGASPAIMLREVGIPTFAALLRARKVFRELKAEGYNNLPELVIGGGIEDAHQIAKCLAFGADAVMIGIGFMKAVGCAECGQCFTGKCPKGIATQDPELEKKLILDQAAEQVTNYAISLIEDVKMLAAVCGKESIIDLDPNDLRVSSMHPKAEIVKTITGIKYDFEPDDESIVQK